MSSDPRAKAAGVDQLHVVRNLRQLVRRWWSLELAFADAKGYVVDHGRGVVVPPHNPICQAALRTREGFVRCNRSIEKAIVQLGKRPDSARLMSPCHLGLDVVAAPVHAQGRYHGAVFTCGLVATDADARAPGVIENARQLGLEREAPDLAEGYARVSRLDARDYSYLKDLMGQLAVEVAEFAGVVRGQDDRVEAIDEALRGRARFGGILGKSPAMKRLLARLEKVVASDATVLVTGENGTGKELIARAIHEGGSRRHGPFVAQNCSALNDNLLESELFGHVRGAFTDASRDKPGLFKEADGGTFFLDEVGDMSPAMQVKLLRVLQEGTFLPVGATKPERVDVRVVAATHRPLADMVKRRDFREDLYYRLNVIPLEVPALRDRLEDLPLLCDHFLDQHARRLGQPKKTLSAELMTTFYESRWSGNVRELENAIERLVVLAGDAELIGPELWRLGSRPGGQERGATRFREAGDLASAVQALERELIQAGLVASNWNKTRLAAKLGVSRTTLIKKIKDYGLEDRESAED